MANGSNGSAEKVRRLRHSICSRKPGKQILPLLLCPPEHPRPRPWEWLPQAAPGCPDTGRSGGGCRGAFLRRVARTGGRQKKKGERSNRMPVVGQMACVLHNSADQEMGTCIGTFWNDDNKPPGGKEGLYRYDYNDKQGVAYESYDGKSGNYEEKIDGNTTETVGKNATHKIGGDLKFIVGGSTVTLTQGGTIKIEGTDVEIKGSTVNISGGSGDCKINGISLVNHLHGHDGGATAGPYTVAGVTGKPQ